MNLALERQFATVMSRGEPFTADDVTNNGGFAIDSDHTANGPQSTVGSAFNFLARQGLIVSDGTVVRSNAPHRKGGAIRVWTPTPAGVTWAREVLEPRRLV